MQQAHPIVEQNFPLTYRSDVVKPLTELIARSESCSLIGMRDSAKINVLRFLALRKDVQKQYLGPNAREYDFVLVDLNEMAEVSLLGFYHLFGLTLMEYLGKRQTKYLQHLFVDNPNLLLKAIKEDLSSYIQTTGNKLVIMFNNLHRLETLDLDAIARQLTALRQCARFNLSYVFTGHRPFTPLHIFFRRIVWMKPFEGKDALGVIQQNCIRYKIGLDKKQQQGVLKLSGGHAGMIKFIIQNLVGVPNISGQLKGIHQNPDLQFQCERLLSGLTDVEIAQLSSGTHCELLENLGMQIHGKRECLAFSPILGNYLNEHTHAIPVFVYDKENEHLYCMGTEIDRLLTLQEFKLLSLLIESKEKILSREAIMDHVWKDEYPSDWAFDKLVSRLRKKLEPLCSKKRIISAYRAQGLALTV